MASNTSSLSDEINSLPNPYLRSDEPRIGPVAIPVMEQVFWLELNVTPEIPKIVEAPEGVTLLDQTKPGPGRARTRLYFRSDRRIEQDAIRIRIENGESVSITLSVRNYREDIEEQIKMVPGIDPSARKGARCYYTKERVTLAIENMRKYPGLSESLHVENRYYGLSDDGLFASLPSWNLPRQTYSNWPCPDCGEKIFEVCSYYPWKYETDEPFKTSCPLCGMLMPTNDFANDDFTSGDFPDDGWGWDPVTGGRDDFCAWIAYYNHRLIWEGIGRAIHQFALRYLLLEDEDAAHKAGVLLARMAYVYPGMNTRWQQVRTDSLREGRLLTDGNWERKGTIVPVCRAYDAIFDSLDTDTALVDFLSTKDETIQSTGDVKALIDTYLIQVFGWDWMRRELSGGNMGSREEDLAQFAVLANMGQVSERWIEELFTHAWNSGADVGGFDDEILINTMSREGPVWIGGLGYATGYVPAQSDLAEILSLETSPLWKDRCDLYDRKLYPKFGAVFDTWIDFLVAGQFGPSYGDSGGGPNGAKFPNGLLTRMKVAYVRAWRRWGTDKLARALFKLGKFEPGLFDDDVWDEIEAQVKQAGPEPPLESRVMDGTGFVFLESRSHAESLNDRAGIALRYGYSRGHHHQDNFNIEMFARGESVAPELGYPSWAHPMGETAHVAHHNTGMIDRARQYEGHISRGDLEMFAGAPEASFADVSAKPAGFPNRMFRRAVCLADAPNGNVYMLDILRLAGGSVRTCCFHGPPFEDFQSNLTFASDFNGRPIVVESGRPGLESNIVDQEFAESNDDVWSDWKYRDSEVRMRIQYLGRPGRRYITGISAKPDVPTLRYLFAEDEEVDGASEFVSLWQPYQGEPFIKELERLPVEGAEPNEFQPVVVQVTLAGGQVDTFFYSQQPCALLHCGDFQFRGSFGYWSELEGKLRAVHLVNGGCLTKGSEGFSDMPDPFRAKITAVDYVDNTIELDESLPDDDDLAGQLIYIRSGRHRTAYHIAEALPSRKTIRLDHNAIIYRSKLIEIAEDGHHIVCEIPPPIEAAGEFKAGYYDGATLTGEDFKASHRVERVDEDRIYFNSPVREQDFPDTNGDGRRMVSIYDFGQGDEVTVYRSVFRREIEQE